jgi:hypothetical protein
MELFWVSAKIVRNKTPEDHWVTIEDTETENYLGKTVRKTPHTTHKGGSREVSHVQSLISRLAGREIKMVQQLLLVSLTLSSMLEKARARDGQREVAGDKGQWGFILQGMKPAAEARPRG